MSAQDGRMRLVDNLSVSGVNVGEPEATRLHIRSTLKSSMMDLMIDSGEGARASFAWGIYMEEIPKRKSQSCRFRSKARNRDWPGVYFKWIMESLG